MQSLITPQPEPERPPGIAAIAGLLAAVSAVSLMFAIFLLLQAVPLSYGAVLLPGGLEQSGPVSFFLYTALTALLGLGLWSRRSWARRLTVLLAAIGVALAVPAISGAVVDGRPFSIAREGLQIVVRVAVIYYLSQQPVRAWFAARAPADARA